MWSRISALGVFFLYAVFTGSATTLECYQCQSVADCNGSLKNNIVQCNPDYASTTMQSMLQIYPTLDTVISPSNKYDCVAVDLKLQGQTVETYMIRGCLYSASKICGQPTISFSGQLKCQQCDQDGCNGAAALAWSIFLLIGGWIVTRMFQ
ncbi:uncharacterized protein LOC131685776 [Topomyia yanbarensis]|uniref:uncharacterized protein LOC131685776 n=1 Tax=Topomyia yanbarensis TaxID=2498891 RepID=UPI00273B743F|nr:uncharacterized protein LOC131685776 [Topomyia yanbarensis]